MPRVWALKKWLCWADTPAPSLLVMLLVGGKGGCLALQGQDGLLLRW
jgi:hypothetical protein